MDVFSGIEVLFFLLGVLTTLGVEGLIYLKRVRHAGNQSLLLSGTGLMLLLFTLAWSASSILENEHQAANMGVLFFGVPALLLLGMAWKKMPKKPQTEA